MSGETETDKTLARPAVLGAGPVGRALVDRLVALGLKPLLITRSGSTHRGSRAVAADLGDPSQAIDAIGDATIVFHVAAPPYHRWVEEFPGLQRAIVEGCQAADAPLIVLENLYGYGPVEGPMTEELPLTATTRKGRVRARLWNELQAEHWDGRLRVAAVRASDFYGPGVVASSFGERFMKRAAIGKRAPIVGSPQALHSVTYVPDIAAAMVTLASEPSAWGRAWHCPTAPAVTQLELAQLVARSAQVEGKVSAMPSWLLGILGRFVKPLGELIELQYEFDSDFVLDSSAFEARFNCVPTPLEAGVGATLAAL